MSQEHREVLIQEIEKAFADVKYPGDDQLVLSLQQPDYWELLNDFKGKHWKEISSDVLTKHTVDLPLFASEAFRFFLPAYLIAALRSESQGDFWEFTFYSFTPPEGEGSEMNKFVNKMGSFNTQQRASIKGFIKLFIETEPFVSGSLKERTRIFWESY